METQKQDPALQNKIELIWAWPEFSCGPVPHSRHCVEIVSSYLNAKVLRKVAQMVLCPFKWTLFIVSKESTLRFGFLKIILKDWIQRRAIPSVLMMMCCPLHGSTAVLEHVWLAWGKRLATIAVVGCHPFVTHTYRGIKHVFQANGYETCCLGALRLMNLWLQPSGSWL